MKTDIKVYADFNNADTKGRDRLNTQGTFQDIERMNIRLESGLELLLDDCEGLAVYGTVRFSEEEKIWVAEID